jgi:hypothetical protein
LRQRLTKGRFNGFQSMADARQSGTIAARQLSGAIAEKAAAPTSA